MGLNSVCCVSAPAPHCPGHGETSRRAGCRRSARFQTEGTATIVAAANATTTRIGAHLGCRELILGFPLFASLRSFMPLLTCMRSGYAFLPRLRAQLCKLSTRRIKARSTTRGSCSANNLAIQRSCSSLTLLVGRQGLARRAQLNFVLTFYLDLMVPIRGRDCTPRGEWITRSTPSNAIAVFAASAQRSVFAPDGPLMTPVECAHTRRFGPSKAPDCRS